MNTRETDNYSGDFASAWVRIDKYRSVFIELKLDGTADGEAAVQLSGNQDGPPPPLDFDQDHPDSIQELVGNDLHQWEIPTGAKWVRVVGRLTGSGTYTVGLTAKR